MRILVHMIENSEPRNPDKKQVVVRVAAILSAIAAGGPHGVRLVELAERTDIARPTVHRLLGELREVGYVEQLPNKRHVLGSTLGLLGLAAPTPISDVMALQNIAQDLSDQTGDTVYIAMRNFGAAYYLVRTEGAYPVRARAVERGQLMALTSSYSGLVFLGQLPKVEREEHFDRAEDNHPALEWRELSPAEYVQNLRHALSGYDEAGLVFGHDVVVPGISGMAMPVPTPQGTPYLAVSLAGINSRFQADRKDRLHALLRKAAARISAEVYGGRE